jgi:alpha-1,3-glucan synthase
MIVYSPLDFSVLDPHMGNISEWQNAIDAIHARGMYFMADFTVGTMGDLLAFDGSLFFYFSFPDQYLILFHL